MSNNSSLPCRSKTPTKTIWALIISAFLLSLISILLAYVLEFDFFKENHHWSWNFTPPGVTQIVSVALSALLALGIWRSRTRSQVPLLLLFWIGLVILGLPLTDTFGVQDDGVRRWVILGRWFSFRADIVGILLILPQWIRWAAGEPREIVAGFCGKVRQGITPSAAFTLTLIAVNTLFLFQRCPFGSYLFSGIGLLLWYFGRLQWPSKIVSGILFGVLFFLFLWALPAAHSYKYRGPRSNDSTRHMTDYYHSKIPACPLWDLNFEKDTAHLRHLPKGFYIQRCYHYECPAGVMRRDFNWPPTIVLMVILASMGVALVGIARQPGLPEQSLRRIAFAGYLFLPLAGSAIRTLTDAWFLPAMSFPFVGMGLTVATTSWLALGLLLRETKAPLDRDIGVSQEM
jgi:hypothetical protein